MIGPLRSSDKASPLQLLDNWLMQHPEASMRITLLAMYALYLCAPRVKEYAFFEVALYAAVLIAGLPAATLAAVLTIGVAIPTLASVLGIAFMGGFGQLTIALICFWLLLPRESSGQLAPHGA